jgi:hypothetical protein
MDSHQAVTEGVSKGGERPRLPQISERKSLDLRTYRDVNWSFSGRGRPPAHEASGRTHESSTRPVATMVRSHPYGRSQPPAPSLALALAVPETNKLIAP